MPGEVRPQSPLQEGPFRMTVVPPDGGPSATFIAGQLGGDQLLSKVVVDGQTVSRVPVSYDSNSGSAQGGGQEASYQHDAGLGQPFPRMQEPAYLGGRPTGTQQSKSAPPQSEGSAGQAVSPLAAGHEGQQSEVHRASGGTRVKMGRVAMLSVGGGGK